MTDTPVSTSELQAVTIPDLLQRIKQLEDDLEHQNTERQVAETRLKEQQRQHMQFVNKLNVIVDLLDIEIDENWTHAQREGAERLWRGLLSRLLNRYTVQPTATPSHFDPGDVENILF